MTTTTEEFTPVYDWWRHGGWVVQNVRYPSDTPGVAGTPGLVSRNFHDKKWRIIRELDTYGDLKDPRVRTFPTRDAAARAEYETVRELKRRIEEQEREGQDMTTATKEYPNVYTTFRMGWTRGFDGTGKASKEWTNRCVRYPDGTLGKVIKSPGGWKIVAMPSAGVFRTRADASEHEWKHVQELYRNASNIDPEPEDDGIVDAEIVDDDEPVSDPHENVCGSVRNGTTCTEPKRHKGVHRAEQYNEAGDLLARHYWGKA